MGEHVPTYREIALAQAVISHGKVEVPMSLPHSNYHAPNSPADIVKAAVAYERFLDRSWQEPEEMAAKLAAVMQKVADITYEEGEVGAVLEDYNRWRAGLEEPF